MEKNWDLRRVSVHGSEMFGLGPAWARRAARKGLRTERRCAWTCKYRDEKLKENRKGRQACSSQIQYLSNSTKITTNTETEMLSKKGGWRLNRSVFVEPATSPRHWWSSCMRAAPVRLPPGKWGEDELLMSSQASTGNWQTIQNMQKMSKKGKVSISF